MPSREIARKGHRSLRGTIYFQSTDYPGADVFFEGIAINDTDGAYMWGEDDINVHIYNSDLTLVNDCYPDQPIVECLNSLTFENCRLLDDCYWDSNEGCVKDSNGEPATRMVRIISDETVGIDNIAARHAAKPDAVYDMMGRRLGSLPSKPGLYIQNGRKVAVK